MAFRIQPHDESVEAALQHIAAEQVAKAIDDIDDDDLGLHETVHEVRKRCKKVRGLLRLFRPALPAYAAENAWFRDEARKLSELRDATSLLECCDALAAPPGASAAGEALASVGEALLERREAVCSSLEGEQRLKEVRRGLEAAAERIDGWSLEARGFDAIGPGLEKTYRRARKAMHRALREPGTENLHEWRKRVKYHRYHLRLLRELWPPVLRPLRDEAKLLSDRLGDDHDLAVLRQVLVDEPERFEARGRSLVLDLADARRAELLAWSRGLGQRLLAEKPKRMRPRLHRVWRAWRLDQQVAARLPEGSETVV